MRFLRRRVASSVAFGAIRLDPLSVLILLAFFLADAAVFLWLELDGLAPREIARVITVAGGFIAFMFFTMAATTYAARFSSIRSFPRAAARLPRGATIFTSHETFSTYFDDRVQNVLPQGAAVGLLWLRIDSRNQADVADARARALRRLSESFRRNDALLALGETEILVCLGEVSGRSALAGLKKRAMAALVEAASSPDVSVIAGAALSPADALDERDLLRIARQDAAINGAD